MQKQEDIASALEMMKEVQGTPADELLIRDAEDKAQEIAARQVLADFKGAEKRTKRISLLMTPSLYERMQKAARGVKCRSTNEFILQSVEWFVSQYENIKKADKAASSR